MAQCPVPRPAAAQLHVSRATLNGSLCSPSSFLKTRRSTTVMRASVCGGALPGVAGGGREGGMCHGGGAACPALGAAPDVSSQGRSTRTTDASGRGYKTLYYPCSVHRGGCCSGPGTNPTVTGQQAGTTGCHSLPSCLESQSRRLCSRVPASGDPRRGRHSAHQGEQSLLAGLKRIPRVVPACVTPSDRILNYQGVQ